MDETKPSPPTPIEENGGLSTGAKIGITVGVIIAIVILLVVFSVLMNNPLTTETLRDVAIIVLALQTQVILVLLGILIYQLTVLTKMLRDDVKPMIESTQDTLNTVRGTATFVSERVTKPAISASSYVTGISRSLATLFAMRPRQRPGTSTPSPGNEPVLPPE